MIDTVKIYYKSKLAIVRDSVIDDVFELARTMRPADKAEIWKSNHRTPESALVSGYTNSAICMTIERKESPIAMFGAVPYAIMSRVASVWLLASPELNNVQRTFIKYSRSFIDLMLSSYPILENYVDVENKQSIRWLKWCSAEFGPAVIYGVEQQLFHYFRFRRNHV